MDMFYYFLTLAPVFVSIYWSLTLFLLKGNKLKIHTIMAFILLGLGAALYILGSYFEGNMELGMWLEAPYVTTILLIIPLMFFYFRFFTDSRPIKPVEYLVFLPTFLVGGATTLFFILLGKEDSLTLVRDVLFQQEVVRPDRLLYRIQSFVCFDLFCITFGLQMVVLSVFSVRTFRNYHLRLNNFFSDMEGKFPPHLITFIIVLSLLSIAIIVELTMVSDLFVTTLDGHSFIPALFSVFYALCLYYVGHFTYHIRYSAEEFDKAVAMADVEERLREEEVLGEAGSTMIADSPSETTETKSHPINETLKIRLTELMEIDKAYLQPDLRINNVAEKLHTNRTYISTIINEAFDKSFSEFVNDYRVRHAIDLIKAQNGTLEEIARDSGFSNSTSFYRVFRDFTGMAPSAWQKENA